MAANAYGGVKGGKLTFKGGVPVYVAVLRENGLREGGREGGAAERGGRGASEKSKESMHSFIGEGARPSDPEMNSATERRAGKGV